MKKILVPWAKYFVFLILATLIALPIATTASNRFAERFDYSASFNLTVSFVAMLIGSALSWKILRAFGWFGVQPVLLGSTYL